MSEFKILIVEDEPVIAENIAMYLNNYDFIVSGIAYDDEEAKSQLNNNIPDAVILDINLDSAEDGIKIADYINKNFQLPFLFFLFLLQLIFLCPRRLSHRTGYIVLGHCFEMLLSILLLI